MPTVVCTACHKLITLTADDTGPTLLCPACGMVLENPIPRPPRVAKRADHASQSADVRRTHSAPPRSVDGFRRNLPLAIGALVILLAGLLLAPLLLLPKILRGGNPATSNPTTASPPHQPNPLHAVIIARKGEAEALAIAGKLADAHAKYREIEVLVGPKQIADSALWDLVERCKQDQDRIYALLLTERENTLLAERATAVGAQPAPSPYPPNYFEAAATTGIETVPTTAPSTRPTTTTTTAPVIAAVPPPAAATTRPHGTPVATTRPANFPPVAPMAAPAGLTDEQIGASITRGIDFLLAGMHADQVKLDRAPNATFAEGVNALVVYSLLKAGQATNDPRLSIKGKLAPALIDRMKDHIMLVDGQNPSAPVTYARSLRAAALAVHNRQADREALIADAKFLIDAANDGAYSYNNTVRPRDLAKNPNHIRYMLQRIALDLETLYHNGEGRTPGFIRITPNPQNEEYLRMRMTQREKQTPNWDNSNSQYGILGVFAAWEAGVEVPMEYWVEVERHWLTSQLASAEWGYDAQAVRAGLWSMTTGGIASLLMTNEALEIPTAPPGREPYPAPLLAALSWLAKEDRAVRPHAPNPRLLGYNLFNLSRIGRLSGMKYVGPHDWYAVLAAKAIAAQHGTGAWGVTNTGTEAIIDTAYTLLFLSQQRSPVLFNKLAFNGSWNNRSRDVANLARFASRELERPVNWQVVPVTRDPMDWTDAPVLYLASHTPPKLTDEEVSKIRSYIDAGGLLFTHADGSSGTFNSFAQQLARKLYPDCSLVNLPQTHDVYSIHYQLKTKPPLMGMSNGSRLLMVHAPQDIAGSWQARETSKRHAWELGMNIFLSAAGKPDLRNRLATWVSPQLKGKPLHAVNFARLRHAGQWDPEPQAFENFARWFKSQTSWDLGVTTKELTELNPGDAPVAHLTGTGALSLPDSAIARLRGYVESGGILLIDPCGGSKAFHDSLTPLLAKIFPDAPRTPIAPEHAIFAGAADVIPNLNPLQPRPFVGRPDPKVESIAHGKGLVLIVNLDLTTALLNTNTWAVHGLTPTSAREFVRNVVLYAQWPK